MTNFLRFKKKHIKQLGFTALLFMFYSSINAQINVSGTVSDENGPIPGVNIILKDTNIGASTSFDGDYTINNVSPNGTLIFSYLGYKTKEVQINNHTQINIILETDTSTLDEIVVIGYGQMKKSDLTGSISTISTKSIEQTVSTSIDQVLQGRVAGVQVQQNSGAPGASSSIRIRGISSLSLSNEPIYVIDGVIISGGSGSNVDNPLSAINPSDIASMNILKDASATAIYGSRASAGVIIITTKRGKKGHPTVNYDAYFAWQEIPKKLAMLNLREYAIHKNTRADLGIVTRDSNFIRPELLGEGTNWQDELFTKAIMQSHNLSVSGGSEKSTYAMGVGYLDQDGIAFGSAYERFNLRGAFDSQVKDFLKIGVNFALSDSKQIKTVSDDALILTALKQTPSVSVRNAAGDFDGPDTDEFVQTNPIGLASIKDNRRNKTGIRANTFAEVTFLNGFKFKTSYAMDFGFINEYKFNPSYKFGAIENTVRESERTKTYTKYWNWTNTLNYNQTFGKHNINMMLGQEIQESHWENLYGYRSGFLTNGSTDLSAGDSTTARNSNNSSTSAISSYFGRLFYAFNDKYLLTTTLRRDGTSKFHKDSRWGWFPSAAFAWKISNESFLENNDVINNLKLRVGWGKVGNQNALDNAYTTTYVSTPSNYGTALLASRHGNKYLKWESGSSSNIGVDLSLFNNRITVVTDVYYKKNEGFLLEAVLPAYAGTTGQGSILPPYENAGSLENKGFELMITTDNISSEGFSWNSNISFSINRNKVLSLNNDTGVMNRTISQGSETTIVTRTAVGQPVGQFYGYKVIGRFEKDTDFYYKNSTGDIVATPLPEGMDIGENSVWIGDYIFEDVNKDGIIDEKDRTYIGNPEADFTLGFNNTFTYKGFDLSISLFGSYGNEVVNFQRRFLENPRGNSNLLKTALGYAQLELIDPNGPNDYRNVQITGGNPYMPRIGASSASSTSNFRYSDRFVEDGSYLRIKNISLGYTFPSESLSRFGIQKLRVYTNTQNVFTFTKYSGFDPEIGSLNQDALITGLDNGRYPSPLILTVGLNVKF